MKPTLFATTAAFFLLSSTASAAGTLQAYFTELGRNCGYGISDGYHAQRYCLPACTTCDSCSPVQHPVIQQSVNQRPMMPQPVMQQPMIPYPAMAPGYTQWAPHQFQQVGYPVGYYAAPVYQQPYPPLVPAYGQPMPTPAARPDRSPAWLW
ncbi:MAG: hypothetical protein H6823_04970 [Planctomycetaceae bacterium]|nr:hypothetical protein [Planctomycetaceae bacterium]